MESRFNLIDEPWIPVADAALVSLRQVFTQPEYRALGGNPVQKIAVLKLLLAISQAAATPDDADAWQELGSDGLAKKCLAYLENWYDSFWLYGDKPFLQVPAIAAAKMQPYGALLPDVSSGNTTVVSEIQAGQPLSDAQKALLLLAQMGFCLSGKKTDNSVVLSAGYSGKTKDNGKPRSGKAGPSVAHMGLLHSFLMADTLQQTLWINLFNKEQLNTMTMFPLGVGQAPWEKMPEGEDCEQARMLKASLMGRLVPLGRFCLLAGDEGAHYSEGIAHDSYKEGVADPSVAVNYAGKDPKAMWVDPERRPWRQLTALLGFIEQEKARGFESLRLRHSLAQAAETLENFAVWSGGLRVSSNAGEQYVSGSDDFVESQLWLDSATLDSNLFAQFTLEMEALQLLATKTLYGRVMGYFKDQTVDGKKLAAQASNIFWQLCERDAQALIDNCTQTEAAIAERYRLRKRFAGYVQQTYDQFCPRDTARQLTLWAKNRPNFSKYLQKEAHNAA